MDEAAAATKRAKQASEDGAREEAKQQRKAAEEARGAAQAAKEKLDAYQKLSGGLMVVGGAMTALTASVIKSGVAYNTLQQTSRAALTTLLGSAEAANAQMDKLDAFARTSPFSKAVFIDAQQQLLGFGMAADRVVPTLDAIQNAVAATGGSNQDIAELTRIIAQLAGGVKISAETFNQFGTRGVDAAGIIGEAMGKTGAQIREEVTAGTLDADQAIQALTDGMQQRFAGAAAGVKDTFDGAMDRVKAAWRDLSADLTRPLVGPSGGGLFVDLLNRVADVMRSFQALPEPVKLAGGAIFALVGITALASGAFIAAVPKVAAYKAAIEALGTGAQRTSRLIGALAKGVGFAAALFALAKGAEAAAKAMGQLGDGAKTANDTMALLLRRDFDGMFDGIVPSIEGITDALDVLHSSDPGDAFNRWGADLFAFTGLTSDVGEARKQFAMLGGALAELVNTGKADRAAELFDEIRARAEEQGYSVEQLNEIMPQYQDALTGAANEADLAAESVDGANMSLEAMEQEADAAAKALDAAADALDGVADSALAMGDAQDKALSAINSLKDAADAEKVALDGTNDASIRFRDSLRNVEEAHRDSAQAILQNGGTLEDARAEWDKGREAVLEMLEAKGLDAAEAEVWADAQLGSAAEVEEALDGVYRAWLDLPENVETKYVVEKAEAEAALEAVKRQLDGIPGVKRIRLESYQVGSITVSPNAAGGLYENGVKSFAAGGFEPGIYPHTPGGIHKFAEEYAEGYVSMDPARRGRSEGVWNAIGNRMGFQSEPSGGSAPAEVRVVLQSKGGIDLLQYIEARVERSDAELSNALRG